MGVAVLGGALIAGLAMACTPSKSTEAASSSNEALNDNVTAGAGLVISQIYGGGGTSTGVWNRGYVELFNRTKSPISLKGVSLHYSGPISDLGLAARLPADAVIPAGGYYLVGFLAGQSGFDLRPDTNGLPVGVLPVNGKLAIVRMVQDDGDAATQKMGCGSADSGTCNGQARLIDLVGYGVTTDKEGAETAAPPGMKKALLRKDAGCTDTGDNRADFEVGEPKPRSASTPVHVCEAP
ncbi:MAG: lamin tail domain-containing protein [Labilithrix sp.]